MTLLYKEKMSDKELEEVKNILDEMNFDRKASLLGIMPISVLIGLCAVIEFTSKHMENATCLVALALMWIAVPIYYAGRYSVVRYLHSLVETESYFRGIKDGEKREETRDV